MHSGATTRRSQIIASWTPAPIAGPFMAPITGIGAASIALFKAIALSGSRRRIRRRTGPRRRRTPSPAR